MTVSPLLDTYRNIPVEDPKQLRQILTQTYTDVANAVNFKEIAQYQLTETLTGQQYYNVVNPLQPRFTYRKCFELLATPPGAAIAFAHNIVPLTGVTYIGGSFVSAVPDFRPLPYVGLAANDYVSVRVDLVNIMIDLGAATSGIASGTLVLEYFKN